MDAGTEADEAFLQQQQLFAAQMQDGPARLECVDEPLEELEDRFSQATGAYVIAQMNVGVSPEEEAIYKQLKAQYVKAKKEREDGLSTAKPGTAKDDGKRRRESFSPLFVQQDEPGRHEELDAINKPSRSKKKRIKTSNSSFESS
jgi:hypothetical protein